MRAFLYSLGTPGRGIICRVADVLKDVGELEILQAPGLPYIIPREYADLTHLTGAHPQGFLTAHSVSPSRCASGFA